MEKKSWYKTKLIFGDGEAITLANYAADPVGAAVMAYEAVQLICKEQPSVYVLAGTTEE